MASPKPYHDEDEEEQEEQPSLLHGVATMPRSSFTQLPRPSNVLQRPPSLPSRPLGAIQEEEDDRVAHLRLVATGVGEEDGEVGDEGDEGQESAQADPPEQQRMGPAASIIQKEKEKEEEGEKDKEEDEKEEEEEEDDVSTSSSSPASAVSAVLSVEGGQHPEEKGEDAAVAAAASTGAAWI